MAIQVQLIYFAQFREQRGVTTEAVTTESVTALDLYRELSDRHNLFFDPGAVRLALNENLSDWDVPIHDGDTVVFLMPFAGG